MLIIPLAVLLVLSPGSYPSQPYSRNWGYYPCGGLGLVVVIVLILLLLGRIWTLITRTGLYAVEAGLPDWMAIRLLRDQIPRVGILSPL